MSQMRDATKNLAVATTMRKSFATNFDNKLDPLHSWGDAKLTTLVWSQGDALKASCRNPQNSNVSTNCHDKRLSSSSVAMWLWSSFASLSISRITSVRFNSSMVFLNHVSRKNRSGMFEYPRFLHFFWNWFAVWYYWSPSFRTCDRGGRPFLM